ncbi:hypothetical protein [Bdellovibrio svalbardensis]|uniref:Lipoprotein n=1 Tax=Bdellovibrio svalbardensis TaxID=2972972 RepID=A0ABT6DM88_9BACT|nr:hypothetical protein [Bdellovibrio svalbardensis]MDG0817719.1 hypothetical protein [Bdellovibrio svalbardensis]
MIKGIIFSLLIGLGSNALASGCDPNTFQRGEIVSQFVIHDFGQVDASVAQKLIENMASTHKVALHYWSKTPDIGSFPVRVKIITTAYHGLDTDCGWTKYPSNLLITHLEITSDEQTFFYPDIYKDISPEFQGFDQFIDFRPYDPPPTQE